VNEVACRQWKTTAFAFIYLDLSKNWKATPILPSEAISYEIVEEMVEIKEKNNENN
jgi:hypothetical protein